MNLSRKTFLKTLGSASLFAGLSAVYMRFVEPNRHEVTEKTVPINRLKTPLRVLHLSDFHASPSVSLESIEKAIDRSLELRPDIAFITGDFITHELSEETEYQRILEKLASRAPTFACIGNHDGGKWAATAGGYRSFEKVNALLDRSGIRLLFNEAAQVKVHDQTITIVGLGDLWSDDTQPSGVLQRKRTNDETIFVLSHNPDSKSLLKPYDWDLLCCGHTHGGQLVVPFLGYRPFLPVRDKSFPEGLLDWGDRYIHVTRGIGNLHGLRFNCRPEISVLNVV